MRRVRACEYAQGTWGCSFRDDCDPSALENNSTADIVLLLRTTRIFRIFWIFKNFNILSSHTFLSKLMVRPQSAQAPPRSVLPLPLLSTAPGPNAHRDPGLLLVSS